MADLRRLVARKVIYLVITLFAIATLNFIMFHLLPGEPGTVLLPGRAPREAIEQLRIYLGLDRPLWYQYWIYMKHVVTLDLGESWYWKGTVLDTIMPRLQNTLIFVGIGTFFAIVIGTYAGMLAGARRGKPSDILLTGTGLFFYSIPAFWMGMILLLIFAVQGSLAWFPLKGSYDIGLTNPSLSQIIVDRLYHLFLPVLTFVLTAYAEFTLIMRNSLTDAFTEDYIQTARAKGLSDRNVLRHHAVPNAMLPTVANTAMYVGYIVTGAIQIEVVFSWDGIGRLTWDALQKRDFPVLQGIFLILATVVILANFVADIISLYIDPRLKA